MCVLNKIDIYAKWTKCDGLRNRERRKNKFTLQLLRLMAYVTYSLNISIPIRIHPPPTTLGSFDPDVQFILFYDSNTKFILILSMLFCAFFSLSFPILNRTFAVVFFSLSIHFPAQRTFMWCFFFFF